MMASRNAKIYKDLRKSVPARQSAENSTLKYGEALERRWGGFA